MIRSHYRPDGSTPKTAVIAGYSGTYRRPSPETYSATRRQVTQGRRNRTCPVPVLVMALALVSGCGSSSPTAPTSTAPLLCASGQSNMWNPSTPKDGLLPVLQQLARAQGWGEGAQPIAFWDDGQRGWATLAPFLTSECAVFDWFQGESDDVGGETPELGQFGPTAPGVYRIKEADLFRRVRARTSPTLPIVVIQIAPRFVQTRAEQFAACSADPHCTFVQTDDLNFADGTHLDEAGYRALAQRLVALTPR